MSKNRLNSKLDIFNKKPDEKKLSASEYDKLLNVVLAFLIGGAVFGILGFGIGLIFFGFLQAVGISLVSGLVASIMGIILVSCLVSEEKPQPKKGDPSLN